MAQQVNDGYYRITTPDGEEASQPTVSTHYGRQWVEIHGQTRPLVEYLDRGYTFTPLVEQDAPQEPVVSDEVIEAIDWIVGFATQPPRVPPLHESIKMQRVVRKWLDSVKAQRPTSAELD